MKELLRRLFARPVLLVEMLAASLLVNVLALGSTIYVIQVLNRYVSYGVDATLVTLTIGVMIAVALEFAFRHVRLRLAQAVVEGPDEDYARRLFHVLTTSRQSALEQVAPGMRQEVMNGLSAMRAAYNGPNLTIALDVPFALVFVFAVFLLSPVLALITGVVIGAVILVNIGSAAAIRAVAGSMVQEAGQGGTLVGAAIGAADSVRAFNAGGFAMKKWLTHARRMHQIATRMAMRQGLQQSVTQAAVALLTVGIIAYGATLVVGQQLNVGALIGANILAARALAAITRFVSLGEPLARADKSLELARQFAALPLEPAEGAALAEFRGRVGFRDVGFLYPGGVTPLFETLNLDLTPGSVLVVTGGNGAGKTTLCRLLLGLLEPQRGHITADGVGLRQLHPEWWRRQVAYLPQEPTFVHGSIRDNLLVANPAADDARINAAVRMAGLRPFIDESAKGLDTAIVENGRALSFGTRRRLALARALMSDAMLVVFDEPTEGMDADGFAVVYEALNRLSRAGRTIVACSNDPGIVRAARFVLDLNVKPVPGVVVNPNYVPPAAADGDRAHPAAADGAAAREGAAADAPDPGHEVAYASSAAEPAAGRSGAGAASHGLLAASLATVAAFGAWAHYGRLDIVSVASGEVQPSSRVKSVQHLEGGIVRRILVRENDRVAAGQPLVELETTQSGAEVSELTVRISFLRANIARLEAEVAGAARIAFPDDLVASHPALLRQTVNLFEARHTSRAAQIASQRETITKREQEVREIGARIANTRKSLKLIDEQIVISEDLLKEQITSRYTHISLLREKSGLQSRLEEDDAAVRAARAAIEEAKGQLRQTETGFVVEARGQLEGARRELNEFAERLRRAQDSLTRTVLRAPEAGVVKQMHVSTVGGVVKAGDAVVDLVPLDDRLVVEAALPTHDIGYVQSGQQASIKLAAPDLARFGIIRGHVVYVSPDTMLTAKGLPYYRVRIETASDHFERGEERYNLYPGMQVVASIETGKRRVVEYLMDPFLGGFHEALRER